MSRKDWAGTPNFIKRFWSAMVKFGSPKLTEAALRTEVLYLPCLDAEFEAEESLKHATPSN